MKEGEDILRGLKRYDDNIHPHHGEETDAIVYWNNLKDSEASLAKLANHVFKLCPSSASIETLFKVGRNKTEVQKSPSKRD